MHPRAAFRISLAAGLLVLAVTLLSATQEPVRPCGNLPQNYAPIIAFELARNAADLQAIFGTQQPCRSTVVERMDAINLVDVLVYIPAYGVFMAFFFLGMRSRNAALGTLGFRICVVAALGDFAENACLMSLTPALDPSSAWFALLPWATGVKWLGLGMAGAIAAALYVKSTGARAWNIVAALMCAAAFFSTVAAIAAPAKFGPIISLGVGLSWLAYLITASGAAFRPIAPDAELPRPG
ncbi:MAG TPA: hypothetical protein VGQ22_10820 [Steroidobacteraceae bacterium]|jgi:hypothetical protein|nr:hypothetical protein [Steroidobacteraceae bacterium]